MSVAHTGYGSKCGAKTRSGGTCGQPGIAPSGRCRLHGGATPRGIDSPHFKGALSNRSSKGWEQNLVGDLLDKFEVISSDPDLMNLSAEIAVVTAHLQQQVKRMEQFGDSPERWLDARKTFNAAMLARRRKQGAAYASELEKLAAIFQDQYDYQRSWDDILKSFRTLERLVAREHKRRIDLHSVMTTEQTVALLARMMNLVTQYIKDDESLKGVHKGFREILVGAPHLARGMAKVAERREKSGDQNILTQSELIDVATEGFVKGDIIEAEFEDVEEEE